MLPAAQSHRHGSALRRQSARDPRAARMPVVDGLERPAGLRAHAARAKALANSTLVPQQYQNNLPNCLIALEMAQRIGASPLMVMQNLYIVHGRPGWLEVPDRLVQPVRPVLRGALRMGGEKGKDDVGLPRLGDREGDRREDRGPADHHRAREERRLVRQERLEVEDDPRADAHVSRGGLDDQHARARDQHGPEHTEELGDVFDAAPGAGSRAASAPIFRMATYGSISTNRPLGARTVRVATPAGHIDSGRRSRSSPDNPAAVASMRSAKSRGHGAMTDTAILPCPFCGDSDPAIDEIDSGIWAVCCDDCKMIGPHTDGEHSAEQAITAWNRRVAVLRRRSARAAPSNRAPLVPGGEDSAPAGEARPLLLPRSRCPIY
jgi:Lar family restriction alleviation protein